MPATTLHTDHVTPPTKPPKRKRRRSHGDTPCRCEQCHGATWPGYYVGSSGWSWECWLEENPPEDEPTPPRTERQALAHGLSIRVRRRRNWKADNIGVMRGRCPLCEGLMAAGAEYCRACEWQVRMGGVE
jgi:transposase